MRMTGRGTSVLAAAAAVLLAAATAASATPGRGVEATTLAERTVDGTDYVLKELHVAPGGSTGWHTHAGVLHAEVERGTLTHNAADCTVDGVYGPGDRFTEPAGETNVHVGRNLGETTVVMKVLYVLPEGSEHAEDAENPGCDFE